MTIQNTSPRNQYTANGSQTVFTYSFEILNQADIKVFVGATQQTITTHYTVSGVGSETGGTITFLSAPANGAIVTLLRSTTRARTVDYQPSGAFNSAVVNADFDRLMAIVQELDGVDQLSLRIPTTDTTGLATTLPVAASRANKAIVFDASGNISVSVDNYVDQLANVTAQANAASASAGAAATSATAAANTLDEFDDRYLGSKASNPTLDNDGAALLTGALHWNTTDNIMRVWTGSAWNDVSGVASLTTSGVGLSVNAATGNLTITSNATSANTANTIVSRDASGNFSAEKITTSTIDSSGGAVVIAGSDSSVRLGSGAGQVRVFGSGDGTYYDNQGASSGFHSFRTNNGVEQVQVSHTASAVNTIRMSGAATGGQPFIRALGEANTGLQFWTQGTGNFSFRSGGSLHTQLEIIPVSGATRSVRISGSNGGNPSIVASAGSLALGVSGGTLITIDSSAVITGTATAARYSDLAEYYTAAKKLEAGTVVKIAKSSHYEVEPTNSAYDTEVFGVVSTQPGFIMNHGLAESGVPVALAGRVPVKVIGPVKKGQQIVTSPIEGVAQALTPEMIEERPTLTGAVIGRALAHKMDAETGLVECVVVAQR